MRNGMHAKRPSVSCAFCRLRNPEARKLMDPKYRMKVVKAKKGKGAYTRKQKHKGASQ